MHLKSTSSVGCDYIARTWKRLISFGSGVKHPSLAWRLEGLLSSSRFEVIFFLSRFLCFLFFFLIPRLMKVNTRYTKSEAYSKYSATLDWSCGLCPGNHEHWCMNRVRKEGACERKTEHPEWDRCVPLEICPIVKFFFLFDWCPFLSPALLEHWPLLDWH